MLRQSQSQRRKHFLPHRPARLHAGLLLRRHALPGHRAEEESYAGKLYAYRAAVKKQYEQGNEKLYLKQAYDTAQLFNATRPVQGRDKRLS